MTLNTYACTRLSFSHSLFHKHSPSPTLSLKTLLISSWTLELFFFLELLPKFDHVRFQIIWAYFLLYFERTTKDNLNHYLLNLFVFQKEVSSVQWGKSTAKHSHGKIVLAISSILRTPLCDLGIVSLRFEYFNVIDVCFCSLCARMMSWHARATFREWVDMEK